MVLRAFHVVLVYWIVITYIALSYIEIDAFRDLIKLLNPTLFEYLYKSGNTIRKLVMDDFEGRKERVKKELADSLSKIYISFDLWISPNSTALLGVIIYYLNKDLQARSLLITLKEVDGSHSGENMAAIILPVLREFCIDNRIGYFISDNMTSNNLAIQALYRELKLINLTARRLRCLGYIINLSAKAFLYSKEEGSFDFKVNKISKIKFDLRQAFKFLMFWCKKGPIGKLHNLIIWICATPQRRKAFKKITSDKAQVRNSISSFSGLDLILIWWN